MPIGRQAGDTAIATHAARSSMRRWRGEEWAAIIGRVWPADPVADPSSRIEEWRSLFARPPREALARAIAVFDAWGLWQRLRALDGPSPEQAPSRRELETWRARYDAPRRVLETIEQDLPDSLLHVADDLKAKLSDEVAQRAAGFVFRKEDGEECDRALTAAGELRTKGKHGAPELRRRFFGPVARALRQHDPAYWGGGKGSPGLVGWSGIADLILLSDDDWQKPPCPRNVARWKNDEGADLADVLRKDLDLNG